MIVLRDTFGREKSLSAREVENVAAGQLKPVKRVMCFWQHAALLSWAMVCQSYRFVELQEILTSGARGWQPFSMSGIQYMVVSNENTDAKIYRWHDASSTFLEMQSISTKGAWGWAAFSMNGIQHLAVSNHYDGSSYDLDSKVYKWDDGNSSFLEMPSIPTKGCSGFSAFSMNGFQHLQVANFFDDSKVYRWDDATSSFSEMQSIPTHGASGWAAFSMNGIQHLTVSNHYDGLSYDLDSKIYR